MLLHFAELTRDRIAAVAPSAVAVLPIASIEQHGPHLPVITDTLQVDAVVRAAGERAGERAEIVLAPTLAFGNSHHHYPFAGVLSLSSPVYMAVLSELLEGLARSGFRKLVLINGHGGNTHAAGVVGLDLVHRLGQPVSIATCDYWDCAREAVVGAGLIPADAFPGHAAVFETSMVMALRPDLVDRAGLAEQIASFRSPGKVFQTVGGVSIHTHGVWAAGTGATHSPAGASAELGQACLDLIAEAVAAFLVDFWSQPAPMPAT